MLGISVGFVSAARHTKKKKPLKPIKKNASSAFSRSVIVVYDDTFARWTRSEGFWMVKSVL